ncbi:MAG TPA: AIR synthase-related protein [Candidatus Dormibacteraeota bacterium]|jgi:hydrogenase maturation factor|nr:AIR synthase-related protein [Candidatus Dormibacteraeota bacterium]
MPVPAIPPGKLPTSLLRRLLADGGQPREVRLGPAVGEDASAIEVPAGVLVASTDPITLAGRGVGRFAAIISANDVAVTGARPRWFLATVLMPPGTVEADLEELFADMRSALDSVGAALVGGHTEITAAVSQPVVVGQMLGMAEPGRLISTGGVGVGDAIVQIGAAPIEGAAVLAAEAADRLSDLDPATLRAAVGATLKPGISVVEPALEAARLGATALHDPTEGGIASGLHEIAAAGGVGLTVEPDRLLWFQPGLAVCSALGADPWATLASGALLAAFPARAAGSALAELTRWGHPARRIGTAGAGSGVRLEDGRPLPWPERDEVARILAG